MKETWLFEELQPEEIKINKKIRLIELFGGIGSQAMALRDIGADFEHYRLVEFDKYAVKSYNAIHGTNFNTQDIKNTHGIDLGIERRNEFTYLLTYSFPCTDLSIAGRMEGMSKESGTRSGLLWEVERILEELGDNLPDILIMENVPQVHNKKNIKDFETWCTFLENKGYKNFWQDMNSSDYGIAQSRNRCFMVSIMGDYYYEFPDTMQQTTIVDDYLEYEVEDKYFINSEKADKLIEQLIERGVIEPQNRTEQNSIANLQLICQVTSHKKSVLQPALQPHKEESVNAKKKLRELLPCLMNYRRVETIGNKVAKTLMARDCKGFGTGFDVQNGVIQIDRGNK